MQGLLCWLQGSAEDTSLELVPCSRTSCAPEQALHQATTRPLRESLRALQVPASPSDRTSHCAVIMLRAYRCFHTLLIVQGSVRNRRIITLFTLQLIQTTSIINAALHKPLPSKGWHSESTALFLQAVQEKSCGLPALHSWFTI